MKTSSFERLVPISRLLWAVVDADVPELLVNLVGIAVKDIWPRISLPCFRFLHGERLNSAATITPSTLDTTIIDSPIFPQLQY